MRFAVALGFLALNFYTYHYLATQEVRPERRSLTAFPLRLGDWRCNHPEVLDPEVEGNLGVSDYLVCVFERTTDRAEIAVYVGYHAAQVRREGGGAGKENMIHPPAHCLPGSGWDIIDSRRVALDLAGLPGGNADVNRLVIAKGEARQLVYYWYQERGRVIARDWQKIVDLFWDRATRSRTDGALVRFSAPIPARGDAEEAERKLLDLAGHIVSQLPAYVPN
jgi:EpsI family protein